MLALNFVATILLQAQNTSAQHGEPFSQLQHYFHQKTDEGKLAGTVILLAQGERRWLDVYGKQNLETGTPMSENTIFRIASMTKPLSSVAVLMLVEQGKLQLDDAVEKYLPAFGNMKVWLPDGKEETPRRALTIRDLLTHTGGIASNFFQNTPVEKAYVAAFRQAQPASLAELVDMLPNLPLAHHPGEGWTYGFSTDVLGRIVEIASDMPLDAFFQKNILDPLKMESTGFQVLPKNLPWLASNYGKGLALLDAGNAESPFVNGQNFPRGNGGLTSSAGDYLRFCQMLLNGGELDGRRLLRPETVAMMMTNQLPAHVRPHSPGMPPICNGFGYGWGVQTEPVLLGSAGDCAWPGANLTYFFIDPTHGGIGVFMTQSLDYENLPMLGTFHNLASEVFKKHSQEARKDLRKN